MKIDSQRREVLIGERRISLTNSEFDVLAVLTSRPGQVFTREQIISQSKGNDYPVTSRSIDFHVIGLRRKLGQLGGNIRTVRGIGYQFLEAAFVAESIVQTVEPSP